MKRARVQQGAARDWRNVRQRQAGVPRNPALSIGRVEYQFNFDYLADADQSVARAYGPGRTPEVFLLDGDRRLVYHGAIDDSRNEDAVTSHYLRDALDAVLAGGTPEVQETMPVGCTLKWRR